MSEARITLCISGRSLDEWETWARHLQDDHIKAQECRQPERCDVIAKLVRLEVLIKEAREKMDAAVVEVSEVGE